MKKEADQSNKDSSKNKIEKSEKEKISIPWYITSDCVTYEKLKPFALKHRKDSTRAESILWEALRNKKIGYKFRRQHIVDTYIVDFVCLSEKLTIEVDGDIHNSEERIKSDKERTESLNTLGYSELRFTNDIVIDNLDKVIEEIKNFITTKNKI